MTLNRTALVTLLAMAPLSFALAQSATEPQDQTSPNAASSPHQRAATNTEQSEAPATNGAEPAAASSPHQRSAMKDDKTTHLAMLNDCIAKEQAKDSNVSKSQAKKACKKQMKSHSDQQPDSMSKE